jgi:anti-sigma factor (TIGR02949 family)
MSCGNPHSLDCGEALAHLYEYLDGEIAAEDHARIAEHLAECGPCLQEYDVERIVKALVARSCAQAAPSDLHTRVIAQFMQVRTTGLVGPPMPPTPDRPLFG